ncbi:MAG: O-antigen ligase family protein [Cyclobacteriaceae bacterium]|nr:O-antigen ligase family protein [Cyclobacteriaceae bacterium]
MKVLGYQLYQVLYLLALVLVVLTLPFSIKLNSLAIVSLLIIWLLDGNWNEKYNRLRSNRFFLLMCLFYIVHIVGLFYSSNLKEGFFELEKRVAFLIFPLTLATIRIGKKSINTILYCFVSACTIGALVCVINGLYFLSQGDSSYLYYHKLSGAINFKNAIYFSLYIAFSLVIMLMFIRQNWSTVSTIHKTLLTLLSLFLFTFLILLSSKMITTAFMVFLGYFIYDTIPRKNFGKVLMIFIGFIIFFGSVFAISKNLRYRFIETFENTFHQENPLSLSDYRNYHFTGGTIRLAIWKIIFEIVNENKAWVGGVGTGDHQDLLTKTYVKKNVYPGDETIGTEGFHHYNAHNQFFQFYLSNGLIGLLFFFVMIYFVWTNAVQNKNLLLLSLVLFLVLFSFTESALSAQKGIVFFCFFLSLLYNFSHKEIPS